MTFLLILSVVILLAGAGLFAFFYVQWLRVVGDGKRATPLPRKGDDESR